MAPGHSEYLGSLADRLILCFCTLLAIGICPGSIKPTCWLIHVRTELTPTQRWIYRSIVQGRECSIQHEHGFGV